MAGDMYDCTSSDSLDSSDVSDYVEQHASLSDQLACLFDRVDDQKDPLLPTMLALVYAFLAHKVAKSKSQYP
jgi:hypothetical protein